MYIIKCIHLSQYGLTCFKCLVVFAFSSDEQDTTKIINYRALSQGHSDDIFLASIYILPFQISCVRVVHEFQYSFHCAMLNSVFMLLIYQTFTKFNFAQMFSSFVFILFSIQNGFCF